MKTIKKIFAGSFLIFGLIILLLGTIGLRDSHRSNEDKEEVLAAIFVFGIPSTVIGTWIIWSLRQEHQQKIKQLQLEREQLFLRLLQQQEGRVTITKFALAAQISIAEAKQYLDEKAKQLNANFEPSDKEGIIYRFPE